LAPAVLLSLFATMFRLLTVLLVSSVTSLLMAAEIPFYVGTYTKADGSKGIYRFTLDLESGKLGGGDLAAEAKNPSFLAVHPSGDFLYSANELDGGGGVSAFAINEDGTLKPLNQQSSKGAGACHVSVDGVGKNVLVANYGGGSIASLPIHEDGSIGEATAFVQHTGSSVNPDRQKEPHAHSIYTDSEDRFVYACDLGTDRVYIYKFDPEKGTLTPNNPDAGILKPGSGPRHFAFHPAGGYAYVINELLNTIDVFKHDADTGALEPQQTIETLPDDFEGANTTAEIFVHPNGRFLYGSNRGHDSIAVFVINEQTGKLKLIDHTLTGGKGPRNFAIDPTGMWLIAANQQSNDLFVFKIDPATGKLTATDQSAKLGAPVCVVFPPRG
jgi:6-phosphogluconolactonase